MCFLNRLLVASILHARKCFHLKPGTEVKLQEEVWACVKSACSSRHSCLREALHEISACVHCSVKKNTHLMRGNKKGAPDATGAWKRRLKGSSLRFVEGELDLNSEELASIPLFPSVIRGGWRPGSWNDFYISHSDEWHGPLKTFILHSPRLLSKQHNVESDPASTS